MHNSMVWKIIENIDGVVDYAKSRKENCTEDMGKIKYLLFISSIEKKVFPFAKELIDLFLKLDEKFSPIFVKNTFYHLTIRRVIGYSSSMNIRQEEMYEYIAKLDSKILYLPEIVKFLSKFLKTENKEEEIKKLFISIAESSDIQSINMYYEKILDNSEIKLSPIIKTLIIEILAYKNLEEAEDSKKLPLYRILFLKSAIKNFAILKNKEMEKKCLKLIAEVTPKTKNDMESVEINLGNEYKEIIELEIELLEEMYENFNLENKLKAINKILVAEIEDNKKIQVYRPAPSIKNIDEEIEQSEQPLFETFCTTIVLGEDKILDDKTDQGKIFRNLYYEYQIRNKVFIIMNKIEKDQEYSIEKLLNYLKGSPLINSDEIVFLKYIIEDFINERYIPFICTIVPFIEKVLRHLYLGLNYSKTKVKNVQLDTQTDVNLTDILNNEEVVKVINKDFIQYMKWVMNLENEGLNIRNNSMHGFVESNFYHKGNAIVLFHILIYLSNILRK